MKNRLILEYDKTVIDINWVGKTLVLVCNEYYEEMLHLLHGKASIPLTESTLKYVETKEEIVQAYDLWNYDSSNLDQKISIVLNYYDQDVSRQLKIKELLQQSNSLQNGCCFVILLEHGMQDFLYDEWRCPVLYLEKIFCREKEWLVPTFKCYPKKELVIDIAETQYMAIKLPVYSLPSFCDGSKYFVGTIVEIDSLIRHANDYDLIKEYEIAKGQSASPSNSVLTPIYVIAQQDSYKTDIEFEVLNTWDMPHRFASNTAEIKLLYIEMDGSYYRYVKIRFKGIGLKRFYYVKDQLKRVVPDWEVTEEDIESGKIMVGYYRFGDEVWGFPGLIEYVPDQAETNEEEYLYDSVAAFSHEVKNTLYYCEKKFNSYAELQEDVKSPSEVDYRPFILEILGDG